MFLYFLMFIVAANVLKMIISQLLPFTDSQKDRQRQSDRQTNRQKDRQTNNKEKQ